MKDESKTQELTRLFTQAQEDFDTLARQWNAAADAAEAAERARTQARKTLEASFGELQCYMRALFERGALPTLQIKEASSYLALAKVRGRRELHAELATCAPACPEEN